MNKRLCLVILLIAVIQISCVASADVKHIANDELDVTVMETLFDGENYRLSMGVKNVSGGALYFLADVQINGKQARHYSQLNDEGALLLPSDQEEGFQYTFLIGDAVEPTDKLDVKIRFYALMLGINADLYSTAISKDAPVIDDKFYQSEWNENHKYYEQSEFERYLGQGLVSRIINQLDLNLTLTPNSPYASDGQNPPTEKAYDDSAIRDIEAY